MTDTEKKQLLRNLQTTACDITPNDIRPFPIQAEGLVREPQPHRPKASTIPWWLAKVAYKRYREKYGDRQSLERIGQRGGFGRQELVALIRGRTCYSMTNEPNDTRPFPVQDTIALDSMIPWWLAEIAFSNFDNWPGCTLEDIAVRGGWNRYKLVKLLKTSFD